MVVHRTCRQANEIELAATDGRLNDLTLLRPPPAPRAFPCTRSSCRASRRRSRPRPPVRGRPRIMPPRRAAARRRPGNVTWGTAVQQQLDGGQAAKFGLATKGATSGKPISFGLPHVDVRCTPPCGEPNVTTGWEVTRTPFKRYHPLVVSPFRYVQYEAKTNAWMEEHTKKCPGCKAKIQHMGGCRCVNSNNKSVPPAVACFGRASGDGVKHVRAGCVLCHASAVGC